MAEQAPSRFSLDRFLKGEGAEQGTIKLIQRRVYILPTRSGITFAVLMFAMLLGAIHYNNSLAHALVFLLVSMALISMLYTYRNLHGLSFTSGIPKAVFCGAKITFPVSIKNETKQSRLAIKLAWPKQPPESVDLAPDSNSWVNLRQAAHKRGVQPMGRFVAYTRFPLGLFHAWSHLQFDTHCIVYPKPSPEPGLPQQLMNYVGEVGDRGRGTDDFAGLRDYQAGDSLHHVDWKAFARERGLYTRQFGGDRANEMVLQWQMTEGLDVEARLSKLCRWILEADKAGMRYGLALPSEVIPAGAGEAHRHRCLTALALLGATR